MTKKEFMKVANLENDSNNLWVTVNGIQANISIDEVMNGKPEKEPFEASTILENNPDHSAWDSLYDNYLARVEAEQ